MNEPNEKPASKTADDIYKESLKLSRDEQEKLSCMLQQGLQDQNTPDSWYATPEIAQAWNEEIERREQLHREGKNPDIPWEEARENVLEHLDRLRQ
jgi:hypothetical protein